MARVTGWMDESGEPRFEKRKGKQFVQSPPARPPVPSARPVELSSVVLVEFVGHFAY